MTFVEMALKMYPYWIMGLLMMLIVYYSEYRTLLRVEWKPILKWVKLLGIITIYRIIIFKLFKGNATLESMTSGVGIIPWQSTLTVFWEDALHGLPLAIMALWLGQEKLWKRIVTWAAVVLVMISFGLGHVYQGWIAAFFLSFYVPFTFKKGQEIGFGTVMICHVLYDLATILTLKNFLG